MFGLQVAPQWGDFLLRAAQRGFMKGLYFVRVCVGLQGPGLLVGCRQLMLREPGFYLLGVPVFREERGSAASHGLFGPGPEALYVR